MIPGDPYPSYEEQAKDRRLLYCHGCHRMAALCSICWERGSDCTVACDCTEGRCIDKAHDCQAAVDAVNALVTR